MNFSLQQWRHFVAVAQTGSLGKAARLVHVSQPALTKSIQRLEECLGLQLFDRTGGMTLSAVGRHFLPKARRLLEESGDLHREVTLLTRAASGHVVVGCGPLLAETWVAPAVAEFVQLHPEMEVDVLTSEWQDFPDQLRAGRLDFFLSNLALLQEEADLECDPFPEQSVVWFARPEHPLARRTQIPAAEFFNFPFAGPVVQAWMDDWFQQQTRAVSSRRYRFRVTCSHFPALREIVRQSDCVSGASLAVLAADFSAGRLVPLEVILPPLTLQAGLVWLRHRTLSPAAIAFLGIIKAHYDRFANAQPRCAPSKSQPITQADGAA